VEPYPYLGLAVGSLLVAEQCCSLTIGVLVSSEGARGL